MLASTVIFIDYIAQMCCGSLVSFYDGLAKQEYSFPLVLAEGARRTT